MDDHNQPTNGDHRDRGELDADGDRGHAELPYHDPGGPPTAGGLGTSPAAVPAGLFEARSHFRSDAKMAIRLISLGVIDDDTAIAIVRQAWLMAAKFANEALSPDAPQSSLAVRRYRTAMSVPMEYARLVEAVECRLDRGGRADETAKIDLNVTASGPSAADIADEIIQRDPDYIRRVRARALEADRPPAINGDGHPHTPNSANGDH